MNAVTDIVSIMSNEDKKAFKSFMSKRNKRHNVKNIRFFNLLETDDINILKDEFISGKNADAYHALRKRVYDCMIEFMANRTFEVDTSAEHEVLKLLVVSRVFLEHKLYKTAFKCLAKAESKALPLEQFSLLNEIYLTQIQFAHLSASPQLDETIAKFKANRQKLYHEQQLNIGYALLRRELAEIYHKGKITDFRTIVRNTIETLGVSLDEILSYKSLYQILYIANEFSSINSDFTIIEPFIERSLKFIDEKEGSRHLYYHIYVLYFIANGYLRNRQFDKSLNYLEQMGEQMELKQKKYFNRFFLRHQLLKALALNYSGKAEEAVTTAQKALLKQKKGDPTDINDLWLCLAVIHLQNSDKEAIQYMLRYTHSDSWYETRMGMDWAIKKVLVEILLFTEFDKEELALSRIKSFRKRYKKYLLEVNEARVLTYVQLLEQLLLKPECVYDEKYLQSIESFSEITEKGDIFVVSFVGWLTAKVNRKPVYDTIIEMVNNKH
ncbi:hypothetical protein [Flavobacterium coralii]|uniref:hypothetical protein n=1 Tax=Flavobacterium coralii TaxID=2838017 RepID=UPI0026AF81C3|tara:strand:- start:54115 stop:55602 length:1488 start_codon:yes stop_codon:yes gene_type:complete